MASNLDGRLVALEKRRAAYRNLDGPALSDEEIRARLESLFSTGELARDDKGRFLAVNPERARVAELLNTAQRRHQSTQGGNRG